MKVRAILIDPEEQSLTEIEIGAHHEEIEGVLRYDSFAIGAHLGGSSEQGFNTVYVSDDEITEADSPRDWFQVDADRDPPSSYPIAIAVPGRIESTGFPRGYE